MPDFQELGLDFDPSPAFPSYMLPYTHRVACSTWCPCLSKADWSLQSDPTPDSRLLFFFFFRWTVVPLAALIAAGVRFASARLSLSADYTGDVLGEAQWRWLEQTLGSTNADVTVVLSSVQVLTSNGLVESWGHFPRAQRRLLALLEKYRPAGLLLLSGDVHFAEMTGRDRDHVVEVTSSGLTHSCSTPWFGAVCGLVTKTFSGHRAGIESVFTEKNFGGVELDWEHRRFTVTVYDEAGTPAPGMVVHRDMDDDSIRLGTSLGGATVADMQESPGVYVVLAGLGLGTLCLLRRLCSPGAGTVRRSARKCKLS